MMRLIIAFIYLIYLLWAKASVDINCDEEISFILKRCDYKHYFDSFISYPDEQDIMSENTTIPNSQAWNFLSKNIPFFDVPDKVRNMCIYMFDAVFIVVSIVFYNYKYNF